MELQLISEVVGKGAWIYSYFKKDNLLVHVDTRKNTLEGWISLKPWLIDLAKVTNANFINKTEKYY